MNDLLVIAGDKDAIEHRLQALQDTLSSATDFDTLISTSRSVTLAGRSLPRIVASDRRSICFGYCHGVSPLTEDLGSPSVEKSIRSGGLWGDFVALFFRDDGRTEIVTSPFGQLRLYRAQVQGALIISNSLEWILAAGQLRPAIDWAGLRNFIVQPEYRPAMTSIDGISRIAQGTVVDLATPMVETPWWMPSDYLTEANLADCAPEAQLAEVTSCCVRSWAQMFKKPMLEVSGGLDSSIIAGILSHDDATLVTTSPSEMEGDERHFARTLSTHLGRSLVEFAVGSCDVRVAAPSDMLLPQPGPHVVARHFDQLISTAARANGNDAFFNGGGGDNVFCFSTSAAPIADLLLSRAPLGKIASGIHDVRRLTNSTTAAVLANLVRRLREPPEIKWGYDFTFVREPGVRPDDTVHPWLSAAADTLPGKKRHIRLLAKAQSYGEGLARQRNHPLVLPLLSTPIVEACLRIPTWEWINGGRDRAVARRAFSHMLPLEIRDRRSKAGLSSLFSRIFVKNRSHIREVLLDGRLAGAGLLDRVEIDVATRTDIPPTGLHHYRVIELLEAEYWVQRLQL